MMKLYQRIQMNTTIHFNNILPATAAEWRAGKEIYRFYEFDFRFVF